MANSLSIDSCFIQVRSCLQAENIKLWLEPYYLEGIGPIESELENLAKRLSPTLNMPYTYCLSTINELQSNAIDKLKARDTFKETGVATIKVRVPDKNTGGRLLTLQIKLDVLVEELCTEIGVKLDIQPNLLNLISAGKMLNRLQTLQDQGIQNNQQIMAIVLDMDEKEANKQNSVYDKLEEAKKDDSTLLQKDDSYMDIEDQDGNVVHIPPEEKRAIMMALAIHEKDRAALRRNAFNEALIFLLEADNEYRFCNFQLLQTVDNYALLNLDIVWCYIMLKFDSNGHLISFDGTPILLNGDVPRDADVLALLETYRPGLNEMMSEVIGKSKAQMQMTHPNAMHPASMHVSAGLPAGHFLPSPALASPGGSTGGSQPPNPPLAANAPCSTLFVANLGQNMS